MKVVDFLKSVGKSALKEIPMGNVVLDAIDLITDDYVDKDKVTGEQMLEMIDKLPPETKARVLETQLNKDVQRYELWTDLRAKLENSTTSKTRSYIVMAITAVLLLLSCGYAYMAFDNYTKTGVMPSMESMAIVFGLPAVAVLAHFGVMPDKLLQLILNVLTKNMAKSK